MRKAKNIAPHQRVISSSTWATTMSVFATYSGQPNVTSPSRLGSLSDRAVSYIPRGWYIPRAVHKPKATGARVSAYYGETRSLLSYISHPSSDNEDACLSWVVALLKGNFLTSDCRNCSPYCVRVLSVLGCYFVGLEFRNSYPLPRLAFNRLDALNSPIEI